MEKLLVKLSDSILKNINFAGQYHDYVLILKDKLINDQYIEVNKNFLYGDEINEIDIAGDGYSFQVSYSTYPNNHNMYQTYLKYLNLTRNIGYIDSLFFIKRLYSDLFPNLYKEMNESILVTINYSLLGSKGFENWLHNKNYKIKIYDQNLFLNDENKTWIVAYRKGSCLGYKASLDFYKLMSVNNKLNLIAIENENGDFIAVSLLWKTDDGTMFCDDVTLLKRNDTHFNSIGYFMYINENYNYSTYLEVIPIHKPVKYYTNSPKLYDKIITITYYVNELINRAKEIKFKDYNNVQYDCILHNYYYQLENDNKVIISSNNFSFYKNEKDFMSFLKDLFKDNY